MSLRNLAKARPWTAGLELRRTQALRQGWLRSALIGEIPKPRVNLTRFRGVFAPDSAHRVRVTPAKRGQGSKASAADAKDGPIPAERRAAMSWAQQMKRVFNIDIESCKTCGGQVKIIACIEDPAVIDKILARLERKDASRARAGLPQNRALTQAGWFG